MNATLDNDDSLPADDAWRQQHGILNAGVDLGWGFVLRIYDDSCEINHTDNAAWYGHDETLHLFHIKTRGEVRQLFRLLTGRDLVSKEVT